MRRAARSKRFVAVALVGALLGPLMALFPTPASADIPIIDIHQTVPLPLGDVALQADVEAAFTTQTIGAVEVPDGLSVEASVGLVADPGALVTALKGITSQTKYAVILRFDDGRPAKVVPGRVGVPTALEFDSAHLGYELSATLGAVPPIPGLTPAAGFVSISRGLYFPGQALPSGVSVAVVFSPDSNNLARKIAVGYHANAFVPATSTTPAIPATTAPTHFNILAGVAPGTDAPGTNVTADIQISEAQRLTLLGATFVGSAAAFAGGTEPPGTGAFSFGLATTPSHSRITAFIPAPDPVNSCTVGSGPAGGELPKSLKASILLTSPTATSFTAHTADAGGATMTVTGGTSTVPVATSGSSSLQIGVGLSRRDHNCSRSVERIDYEAGGALGEVKADGVITQPRTVPRFQGDDEPETTYVHGLLKDVPAALAINLIRPEIVEDAPNIFCVRAKGIEDQCVVGRQNAQALLDATVYQRLQYSSDALLGSVEIGIATDSMISLLGDTDRDGIEDAEDYAYLPTTSTCVHCVTDIVESSVAARFGRVAGVDDFIVAPGRVLAAIRHEQRPLNVTVSDVRHEGSNSSNVDTTTSSTHVNVEDLPAAVTDFGLDLNNKKVNYAGSDSIDLLKVALIDGSNRTQIDIRVEGVPATIDSFTFDMANTTGQGRKITFRGSNGPTLVRVELRPSGTSPGPVIPGSAIKYLKAEARDLPRQIKFEINGSFGSAANIALCTSGDGVVGEICPTADITAPLVPSEAAERIGKVDVLIMDEVPGGGGNPKDFFGANEQGVRFWDFTDPDVPAASRNFLGQIKLDQVGDTRFSIVTQRSGNSFGFGFTGINLRHTETHTANKLFAINSVTGGAQRIKVDVRTPKKDGCSTVVGQDRIDVDVQNMAQTLAFFARVHEIKTRYFAIADGPDQGTDDDFFTASVPAPESLTPPASTMLVGAGTSLVHCAGRLEKFETNIKRASGTAPIVDIDAEVTKPGELMDIEIGALPAALSLCMNFFTQECTAGEPRSPISPADTEDSSTSVFCQDNPNHVSLGVGLGLVGFQLNCPVYRDNDRHPEATSVLLDASEEMPINFHYCEGVGAPTGHNGEQCGTDGYHLFMEGVRAQHFGLEIGKQVGDGSGGGSNPNKYLYVNTRDANDPANPHDDVLGSLEGTIDIYESLSPGVPKVHLSLPDVSNAGNGQRLQADRFTFWFFQSTATFLYQPVGKLLCPQHFGMNIAGVPDLVLSIGRPLLCDFYH